jgi:hypothetical protein
LLFAAPRYAAFGTFLPNARGGECPQLAKADSSGQRRAPIGGQISHEQNENCPLPENI